MWLSWLVQLNHTGDVADVATETCIKADQPYLRVGSDPYRLQLSREITAGVYKNIDIIKTKTTSQNNWVA